jgi:serine O-acetyltransferase
MSYRVVVTSLDRLVVRLLPLQRSRLFGPPVRVALRMLGVDFLGTVGAGLRLPHATSAGLVVNAGVRIGDDVTIYHGVTIGRGDVHKRPGGMDVTVGDRVFIGAGAVILGQSGTPLTIGDDAVIGANAVVTCDVGPGETWAGNPARRVDQTSRS